MQREDPMELNFEGLELQKWTKPTDRAQREDQKNGVICLVTMFAPGVTVIKMSKMAHFLYFYGIPSLHYVPVCKRHIYMSKTTRSSLLK